MYLKIPTKQAEQILNIVVDSTKCKSMTEGMIRQTEIRAIGKASEVAKTNTYVDLSLQRLAIEFIRRIKNVVCSLVIILKTFSNNGIVVN